MSEIKNLPVLLTVPYWKLNPGTGYYYIPELDKEVHYIQFKRVLSKLGKTVQEFYDRWVLNITVPSERPRCKFCNKEMHYGRYVFGGYMEFCDSTCANRYKALHYLEENSKFSINEECNKNYELDELIQGEGRSMIYCIPWIDLWVNNSKLSYYLSKINKTIQDWYDTFILKIEPENRPKCDYCGCELEFKSVSHGYYNTVYENHEKHFCSLNCRSSYYHESSICKGFQYNSTRFGLFNCRSGWEVSYIKMMEFNTNIIDIKYEPLRIPYYDDSGTLRYYYPDFLVIYKDGTKELIEIKANWQLNNLINQLKFKAAKDYCKTNNIKWTILTDEVFL